MTRTTDEDVRSIIESDVTTSLDPFIKTASSLVDWLILQKYGDTLTATQLEVIEMWLTAHFYAHRDQLFQSKNTGKAGGSFQGQTAMVLMSTQYGQTACLLDTSGNLAALSKQTETGLLNTADLWWMGTELDT